MKKLLLLTVFTALVCCKNTPSSINNNTGRSPASVGDSLPNPLPDTTREKYVEPEEEEPVERRYTKSFQDGKKTFVLHIHEVHHNFKYEKIKILEDRRLLQTLPTDSAYGGDFDLKDVFNLDTDANFDGYKDLALMNWHGMVNSTFNFYLYNPTTDKYTLEKSLSKIMDPVFDQKAKTISSYYHIGPLEDHYETYKWKNGKAVLAEEKVEGSDEMGKP